MASDPNQPMPPPASTAGSPVGPATSVLAAGPTVGLTSAGADALQREHGYNEVAEQREHPVRRFLGKFWGMSAWMLELIMVLSAVLRKYSDLVIVAALLIINAVLAFAQEHRAAGVVRNLRQRLQVRARVLRDSTWQTIAARELVPGDIVRLRAGDIIAADMEVVEGFLTVDQSALTGESKELDRRPGDEVSSGSVARRGECTARVTATGARTAFGRTTQLLQQARPQLHIEAVVAGVVRWLFMVVAGMMGLVLIVSLVRGGALIELIPLMLVLLMSAVPVALPVMFTVSMAIGSNELAKRGVLVTRLSAAEDAATMDVLCVDKTGTITLNQLAVSGVIALGSATEQQVLLTGALASQEADQDPIDQAFLAAARKEHLFDVEPQAALVSFEPFDARTRRTEALLSRNGQTMRVMKGALRTVAEACGLDAAATEALEERARESVAKGDRVLAVASGPDGARPVLLGLVTLTDPVRPDAAPLIAKLRELGIGVKMLTGDALPVAVEIGTGVGLPNIRRAGELSGTTSRADSERPAFLEAIDGFAEVYPKDKFAVVQHLQGAGHVTGMTGDGVNDAPALRQAEVGIAVSTATDVAKGAASVVLTDAGLTNIIALVEQGRTIYQRVLTWIINKISRTILKSSFVAVSYLLTNKFVVSAFTMLLLTFMTDFAKIAIATDRVRPSRRPETWKIGRLVAVSVALGVCMVAEALALLGVAWRFFGLDVHEEALSTFSFLLLLYLAVFSIVSVRERRWFWSTKPSTPLIAALIAEVLVGTALSYAGLPGLAPLPWWQTLVVLGYAMFACLVLNDTVKVMLTRWLVPAAAA